MPNIVEYINRENISPSDRGTEAFVQQGRRIGAAYNQVAESTRDFGNRIGQNIGSAIRDAGDAAVQYVEHREVNQGIDTYWQLRSKLENDWLETVKGNPDKGIPPADPHDPAIAQRFMEEKLAPALQNWGDTFATQGGQKWAQARIAGFLDHMSEKTVADMGTMAASQVDTSLRTIFNTASNIAHNDPTAVPHLIEDVKSSVAGMVNSSPYLKGANAARATNEFTEKGIETVVKSGAQGAIMTSRDPEATAANWGTDPRYTKYISGAETQVLAQNARTVIRARDYDQRSAAYYKRQEDTEVSNQAVSGYLLKMSGTNPKIAGDPIAQQVFTDDKLTKADRWKLLQYRERELKPETDKAISEQTFVGLLRELRQPNADPQKVMDHAWDARLLDAGKPGSLTQPDFDRARKEIEDRKTPVGLALAQDRDHFFKRYAVVLDPAQASGLESPAGAQARYRAEMDARRQEQVLKAKNLDPHLLYDPRPGNQYFFGSPENLQRYQTSMQDAAKSRVEALKGNKPGVSASGFNEDPGNFSERFGAAYGKPPENREAGKVYDTPQGKLKWTGSGWVKP